MPEAGRELLWEKNLWLWMASQGSTVHPVRPILWERGYRIAAVSPRLPVAEAVLETMAASGWPALESVRPFLVLQRPDDRSMLLVYLQPLAQAVETVVKAEIAALIGQEGLPMLCPGAWAASEAEGADVLYCFPEEQKDAVLPWIDDAAELLQGEAPSMQVHAASIIRRSDGIFLRGYGKKPLLAETDIPVIGRDCPPLYWLPCDEKAAKPGSYDETVFWERIRIRLAAWLAQVPQAGSMRIAVDNLLQSIQPLWPAWKETDHKARLRLLAAGWMRQLLDELRRSCGFTMHEQEGVFVMDPLTQTQRDRVRAAISSRGFRTRTPKKPQQLELDFRKRS